MNRAERRRQEKRRKSTQPDATILHVKPLLDEALSHHRAGRYPQAEQLYQQILIHDPQHAETHHLLGLIAYRTGQWDRAATLLAKATQEDPHQPTYWFNRGIVLQRQGQLNDAVTSYERALSIHPQYPEALSNVGNVFMEQGRLDEALASYRRALVIKPDYVEAHNNLGVALKEQGKLDEARASYEQALRQAPTHIEAHCNLGSVLMDQGRLDEAIVSFQTALRIKPDYVKALYHLAFAFLRQRRFDQALDYFRQAADRKQNHGGHITGQSVSRSRIKHDAEQVQYLFDHGLLPSAYADYLGALVRLRKRAAENADPSARISLTNDELLAIVPSFNRILRYAESPALPGGALNLNLDVSAIEARYNSTSPEVMYIDSLLTDRALASLRRFCLESTIWKRDYENGYLGAFLGDGFSCPLLLQIAEELRVRFPGIFHDHALTQAWAFKYDSERTGLNIHADAAAVNVNFWITSDEANLDSARGGLVVWDKEAPKEWNFKEYNSSKNELKVREFLTRAGANAVTIPYRANRAVVFNSDLFHETDRFHFKDEYESRRLNVTLLYGRRLS